MNLFLTSAYETHPGLDTVLNCAPQDSVKDHTLSDTPENAEAIVFIENTQFDDLLFKRLRQHELVKAHPEKVFMYNEMDRPWDVLPGLFTCMPRKKMNGASQRPFAYLSTPNEHISSIEVGNTERPWLYSFMGAMSHACRRKVMRLPTQINASQAYLQDTSDFNVWNATENELDSRARQYASILSGSKFVLCPRGIGTSSIRLYETLEAGRVPVIISDQWVPPSEADWSFAIQVRENDINTIPGILQAHASEAIERGLVARESWLRHYAPDKLFNTLGNSIESLLQDNHGSNSRNRVISWNKWVATGGLLTRTTVQRLRGQR